MSSALPPPALPSNALPPPPLHDRHPHGRVLVRPLLLLPVLAGAATFVGVALPSDPTGRVLRTALVAVVVLLLLRYTLWPVLRWRATRLTVTAERVTLTTGVLRKQVREVPLDRIEEVRYERGVLDRLLRSGTLIVRAGTEGRLECRNVADPVRVASALGWGRESSR